MIHCKTKQSKASSLDLQKIQREAWKPWRTCRFKPARSLTIFLLYNNKKLDKIIERIASEAENKMADMVDCGIHTFKAWARQTPSSACGCCWHNRWLGDFNPHMAAEEAAARLENDKLSQQGQEMFKRGWERAQAEYLEKLIRGTENPVAQNRE